MIYSLDLREAVISYINNGGSKIEAMRIFNISRATLYRWFGMNGRFLPKSDKPPLLK